MKKYVIAASTDWFRRHEKSERFRSLDFYEIARKDELTIDVLANIGPRFVFFPHWNWIVPPEIFNRYECVVFHTAPLPYGRGGSPIQNLILRGLKASPVCALRMTESLDGGPIYDAIEVSLEGTIDQIFGRIAVVVEQLILTITENEPSPVEQVGEPVYFKRRAPAESELPEAADLCELYDRIRMVDGQGYPKAFIQYGAHKIEFSAASLHSGELTAKVRIHPSED